MQKQLTPIAAGWLHEDGAGATLRRLLWFSAGMGAVTAIYGALIWLMRDWIFLDLMRKDFAQRDAMLLMWIGLFLMMSMREPLMLLAVLRQRFQVLSAGTLVCALIALAISYAGMRQWGAAGALLGILAGELLYGGIIVRLAWIERRRPPLRAENAA